MKDRYNLNLLPVEDEMDDPHSQLNPNVGSATSSSFSMSSSSTLLPGMGIDEEQLQQIKQGTQSDSLLSNYIITLSLLTHTTHSHYSLYHYSLYHYSLYHYSLYNYSLYHYSLYHYSLYHYSLSLLTLSLLTHTTHLHYSLTVFEGILLQMNFWP